MSFCGTSSDNSGAEGGQPAAGPPMKGIRKRPAAAPCPEDTSSDNSGTEGGQLAAGQPMKGIRNRLAAALCSDTSDDSAAQQEPEPQKKPAATKKQAQQKPEPQKKPAATKKPAQQEPEQQNSTAAKDQGHGLPKSSSSVDVATWAMRILGKSGRFSELRSSVEKRDGRFRLGSLCSGMGTEMIAATGQRLSRVAHTLPHNADSQYVL
jgi:hypothetical protein